MITATNIIAFTTIYSFLMSWHEETWWFHVIWLNGLHFKAVSKHCMALHYAFFPNIFSGISCLFESSSPQKSSYYASKDFILITDFWMALSNVLSQFRLCIVHNNLYFEPSSSAEIMLMMIELHLLPGDWLFAHQKCCSSLHFWYTGNFLLLSKNYSLCNSVKI